MSLEIPLARQKSFVFLVLLGLGLILLRLAYWQIFQAKNLQAQTEQQSTRKKTESGQRGKIYTADGFLLVGNQTLYDLKLDKENFQGSAEDLSGVLAKLLAPDTWQYDAATASAERETITANLANSIEEKFSAKGNWPKLASQLSQTTMEKIQALGNPYLYFDESVGRYYPEASMAAHLTGFVGRDEEAQPLGRYGIEGALEDELRGRSKQSLVKTDALGYLLAGENYESENLDGRDVTLTIRRDIQNLAEESLAYGMEKYQADRGEVIIMESQTGKILAMASAPNYQQWQYPRYPTDILANPSVSRTYEPGSTFKVLTVSAGIDTGVITPETQCSRCSGPRVIGGYTIRTWDDTYHPNITMTEALEKSDNTAMIFVSDLLGTDRLLNYLQRFGIGQPLDIELQENSRPPFPTKVGPVETATISFGQGIVTNGLQLLRAINVIAHHGRMLEPILVEKVYDHQTQQEMQTPIKEGEQVVSAETAAAVTQMMIAAAAHGEAQWIASDRYNVAAKTGTSQVPDPQGGYKEDETIASFVGFAPASNPQFTMLVKLENTKSSPWAAETAAPLWYRIADKLMILMNIQPDK